MVCLDALLLLKTTRLAPNRNRYQLVMVLVPGRMHCRLGILSERESDLHAATKDEFFLTSLCWQDECRVLV